VAQFVARRIWRAQSRQKQLEVDDPEVFRTTYAGRIDPIGDDETQLLLRLASRGSWWCLESSRGFRPPPEITSFDKSTGSWRTRPPPQDSKS
jgi:hypothetical protein